MIVPNKFTSFDNSIISRLPRVLAVLTREISVYDLYKETESSFEDVGEFIIALDALFVLGRIELDNKGGIRPC